MSRHRFVRNININDELEDDALSDGGEEDITSEQEEQLNVAIAETRSIIGSEESSGISDVQIKDAVWEYYFDVEKSVQWLMDEQVKRNAAKERKGAPSTPASPQSPLAVFQIPPLAHKHSNPVTKSSLSALASSRSTGSASNAPKPRLSNLVTNASQVPKPVVVSSDLSLASAAAKPGISAPSKLSLLAKAKHSQISTSSPLVSSVKPSKLALKIQKAREQPTASQVLLLSADESPPEFLPLFHPLPSHAQASPSSFACLLKAPSTSRNSSQAHALFKSKEQRPFSFDYPSPDDIILSARRGTTLASRPRQT